MKTQQSQKKRKTKQKTKQFGIKLTYEQEFKDILNILFLSLSIV